MSEAAHDFLLDINKINEMIIVSKNVEKFLNDDLLIEYKKWVKKQKKVIKYL